MWLFKKIKFKDYAEKKRRITCIEEDIKKLYEALSFICPIRDAFTSRHNPLVAEAIEEKIALLEKELFTSNFIWF